jgi:two-component system nitrate/nitrite response regulator NarL
MILLDLDLGTERGSDLLEKLRVESFTGKILLVTAGVNQSEVPNLIRKGISGIFMKHGSPALLVQGIREAMEGRAIFEQDMLRRSLETDEQSEVRQAADKLSERERQVLSFILEGLANKQIADRLQISESAVKASLQQLFAKTGVRTRSQLVRIALEQFRNQL